MAQNKEEKLAAKEKWLDKLVVNFGNDEGEEGTFSGTVVQALLLMNGQDINNAISDKKDGTVSAIVQKYGGEKGGGASLASLHLADQRHVSGHCSIGRPRTKRSKTYREPGHLRLPLRRQDEHSRNSGRAYYEDIMWALLNSNEFILNH